MANRFKKDDFVKVIAGKDSGKTGKITKVFPEKHAVIVEGVNIKTHFVKPNPPEGKQGGMEKKEAPINWSNVSHADQDGKVFKIGFKILENGKKVRYNKRTQSEIDK
ncbi:MAG: 50S ribosomal protein L24 [Candidatus Comchoanobacterales bacterium]